ncbi:hypothetical protein DH2020_029241 [Rehmannia glutinosa]|uniref:Glycosyltransferase n=1 Tax=Rehmannia glutinosa TaxID=99300 RepID=A0ABR0VP44_REHGL
MGSLDQPEEHLKNIHVFMVSFPGQGHVNPLLRLGKRLADFGLFITFSAPETAGLSIRKANNIADDEPTPLGRGMIRFEFFDDGWDFNNPNRNDLEAYMAQLELVGREKLPQMVQKQSAQGRPVSCLINNPFIPWVSDVAESLGIPSAMLWVQSCACFSVYYHFYHKTVPFPSENDLEIDVQLPFLPLLKHDEIPSFLHPKIRTIFGASHFRFFAAENCVEWLDSKPPQSVVYVSFGSIVHLKQEQIDEIAHGLVLAGVLFLWVLRPPQPMDPKAEPHVLPEGFLGRVGDKGKIVGWAPQEEVLAHPSTGCFVTHCGWNSTMEAVASGVPVVAFPQWGIRIVRRDEVARCLTAAIDGPEAAEMRENALKLKRAAEEAVAEGGSSYRNMEEFVHEVARIGGNK